jgi:catechol 2,3-dioxygenase-like lactoylglutathione lyase family enzyme
VFTYLYLGTNDLDRAIRFYDAAMGVLGHRRCVTGDPEWDGISAGWGTYKDGGIEELALWVGKPFACGIRMGTSLRWCAGGSLCVVNAASSINFQ